MIRIVALLVLLLLPGVALAQGVATDTAVPAPRRDAMPMERLSRAQARQMIADRGYFELSDLTRGKDGGWRCTASAGAGRRVIVTLDKNGNIREIEAPETSRQ
jgi:hypothetical protein